MKKTRTTILAIILSGIFAGTGFTQTPNTICKTGYDANLPIIKIKVANMASKLKRLKQSKQNSRARIAVLRAEILAIDEILTPWRKRHKKAAKKAGKSAKKYSVYKANWIDTGELTKLNAQINLRKVKHQEYKQVREQYQRENTEFEALGAKYQHIARDLLDRDRDCAAAQAALR